MRTLTFFMISVMFFKAQPLISYSYFMNELLAYGFMVMAALSFLNYVEYKMNKL